ncbi:MAG TPA: type II toxin-antitoxin system ParD family antitoxin [Pararhizobium sp.]|uniref:type II toxin-antitoxin system ParD family antitoxin n=1 Tax=Pararhizobium sp. TaxID=1977563 RepID=UPI002CAE5674|nr:type II toxin-antitoxin system ParD family antitoxin [Pararhizobium sp.]HTO29809.1 type II toxin-antitoxin system ParD family antitoxin [Pararhizobium sp.]
MTVKIDIELDDTHRAFAEKMVADGRYPSVSSVIQAGIEQMMENDAAPAAPLAGMADEIRRRMELPKDQWIPFEGDTLFSDIRALIRAKKAERQ